MEKTAIKLAAAFSIAAASTVIAASAYAGEVLDRVLETKTLTVAVGTDWAPISFLNENNELDGYDVEISKAIADYLGVEVNFVTPGWDLIVSGKWQGRWDIGMGQMVPTPERAEKFDFPALTIWGPNVAVVHADSKAISPADLEGKTIGVASGVSAELYANHTFTPGWVDAKPVEYQFTPGEVKTYGSTNIAFDDLRLGDGVRLDAVLTDEQIALDSIKGGYPLKVLKPELFSPPGAIAILPGDAEFGAKIAEAVQGMRDDGRLAALSIKWYGADFTEASK